MGIQHFFGNGVGKIAKAINIKLPKFDMIYPTHYEQKYGLSEKLYNEFKNCFTFLVNEQQHGKLSWMYLKAVLFAHLIHFMKFKSILMYIK